ncbi:MAG: hypothetical protein QM736_14385 [Vicinamibacterales bacterium]
MRTSPIFDCAFKAAKGQRSIHYMGHIKMMGATQPFISGAISKTVNVPKDATVEDIEQAYIQSWKHRRESNLDLPRWQQAHAAAQHVEEHTEDTVSQAAASLVDPAGAPQAPRRTARDHAQVRHPGARGIHHGRSLRGRAAG